MENTGHTNSTTAVEAVPSSTFGTAFEFRCESCAEVARFSERVLAEAHAEGHVSYMIRKEADR